MRSLAIIIIPFFFISCQNKTKETHELKKGIFFSGIFIKEEKSNDREYKLYLKNEKGEILEFISMPFFGENEQKLLQKNGAPNVHITYDEFYNPVRKKVEKIIKTLTPVYGTK